MVSNLERWSEYIHRGDGWIVSRGRYQPERLPPQLQQVCTYIFSVVFSNETTVWFPLLSDEFLIFSLCKFWLGCDFSLSAWLQNKALLLLRTSAGEVFSADWHRDFKKIATTEFSLSALFLYGIFWCATTGDTAATRGDTNYVCSIVQVGHQIMVCRLAASKFNASTSYPSRMPCTNRRFFLSRGKSIFPPFCTVSLHAVFVHSIFSVLIKFSSVVIPISPR